MEKGDRQNGGPEQIAGSHEPQRAPRPAPGKVTRTSKLSPSRGAAVQRKAAASAPGATAPQARSLWAHTMDPLMDAAHRGVTALTESSQHAVQARGLVEADDPASVHRAAAAGVSGTGSTLPYFDRIQGAFGDAHDLSRVQAHTGGKAATASEHLGAQAYATGEHVAFRGQPDLHTAAHEAAHVVQQRAGVQLYGGVGQSGDAYERHADVVADRVVAGRSAADLLPKGVGSGGGLSGVQMRRLPTNTGAMLTDPANPAAQGASYTANAAGIRRLIEIAEAELTPEQRVQVDTATLAGQTRAAFDALPEHTRLTRRVEAIRRVRPDLTLGDPNLIDSGPRAGTQDTANLNSLVAGANAIFDAIAAGGRDADIDQVFGHANRSTAKAKYANGRTWMNNLHASNRIVTDRSGYNPEVGLGGLTGFQRQISLSPRFIDAPTAAESIITMIHESMHAGNSDVEDKGYIGTQVFTQLPEDVKLINAAHFEVIPRRILGAANAYAGQTFTPAGAAAVPGGAATAPLTPLQTAVREASEQLRIAWTMGLNLHVQYSRLYRDQTQWNTPQGGGSFRQGLPYWSKVEKLTIHLKTVTDPASADPARRPISQIDMALSEGVTRKFSQCMRVIRSVPNDAPGATSFLRANATAAEIAAGQATPQTHRDLWSKVALRRVGPITGPEQRDLRVVHELFALNSAFGTVLHHRDPNGFAD